MTNKFENQAIEYINNLSKHEFLSCCLSCGRQTAFDLCIACVNLDGIDMVMNTPFTHDTNTKPYCKEHKRYMKICDKCNTLFCPIFSTNHCKN